MYNILFVLNWALVVSVLAKPSLPLDSSAPIIINNHLENALINASLNDFLDFDTDDDDADDQLIDNNYFAYTESIDKLEALGIDTSTLPKDIVEDAKSTVPEIVKKYGYEIEVHHITTSDGYILELHRLPGKPEWPLPKKKQPILLIPGLLESSSIFVVLGPTKSIAFMLADLGYDVWLGNVRGTRYSRNHIKYNPDGKRKDRKNYWSFSWHEIGVVDVPETIDYVLDKTGYEQLHYIGHSQGTTVFWVMASELPEYNDKIKSMQAFAPVAFMSHLRSPFLRAASLFTNTIDTGLSVLGVYEFLPNLDFLNIAGGVGCSDESPTQEICANILFLICGYNSEQLNRTTIPIIVGHLPAGSSTNQIVHYSQGIRSGKFRQLDHGIVKNVIQYKQRRPPHYNLKNIRAPVVLHYASNDWLAEPVDVEKLAENLPNVVGKHLISDPKFNHLDFVFAIDVKTLLYDKVFHILRLFDQGELP